MYKSQILYDTNADYVSTARSLDSCPHVISYFTEKGLLWFKIKGTETIFMLFPKKQRLQVKWNNSEEKKVLLKIVRELLVPEQGQTLRIEPAEQQLWIEYPPPPNFKLYWCEEETVYTLKDEIKELKKLGFFGWWDRRSERNTQKKKNDLLELRSDVAARMEVLHSDKKFTYPKYVDALHKHRQKYGLEKG